MSKKFFILTFIASVFFFSCSNSEQHASLFFIIPANFSRTITNGESDDLWKLRISLSGEINQNKEIHFSLKEPFEQVVFENLEVGKTVTVDVGILDGEKCFYKTENPQSITLESGDNFVNIKLIRETSSAKIDVSDAIQLIFNNKNNQTSTEILIPYTIESKVVLNTADMFESYQWYLNGQLMECSEKEFNFIPAENDYIEIDNSNTLRCVFTDETDIYFSETEFKVEIQ